MPRASIASRDTRRDWILEVLRAGILAGLAMVPFAAVFRARGLRINEYGRKTLELFVGHVTEPAHTVLTFVQHLLISCVVTVPILLVIARVPRRRDRIWIAVVYGAGFYVVVNSLLLPLVFGDPTPWQLGFETVYPSLFIHLVYGFVIGWVARPPTPA
jgi:uncharacterized membrane protein YagU involved in acid resistance